MQCNILNRDVVCQCERAIYRGEESPVDWKPQDQSDITANLAQIIQKKIMPIAPYMVPLPCMQYDEVATAAIYIYMYRAYPVFLIDFISYFLGSDYIASYSPI